MLTRDNIVFIMRIRSTFVWPFECVFTSNSQIFSVNRNFVCDHREKKGSNLEQKININDKHKWTLAKRNRLTVSVIYFNKIYFCSFV